MRVVGLSGGIATGKSTVSRELVSNGVTVIDCPSLSGVIIIQGSWGWRRVVAAFGTEVLGPDGELDRERLGCMVFNDPAARRRLNAATHLPVALALARRLLLCWLTCKLLVVVDMPLLFETKMYRLTRPNVLVACNDQQQMERLLLRDGGSTQRAQARIVAQLPMDEKRRLADIIVENDGTLEDLKEEVRKCRTRFLRARLTM
ncbi:hypothetical protein VOLCADRAFT_55149 [Volvox carteri f. nagariensis]|uniref:Dephospho-CoA kinase n=1 Tax=Volvox carteri f. nagariensis TaxID=3068 RepID=D8TH79_VOLCA|nr:uncharacterized protein VOLCADRAFT_55149 [Volvox carteri f. nagariensis]EFJ53023.1 hypothetical protein VOLCADRAFT_55149 [Volvox carteri f. nagariensis]|eukprot:XP_002946028.1 hypothetical protein VOLCADRAFT_55149 [Volvox carteri f. nagariensis]